MNIRIRHRLNRFKSTLIPWMKEMFEPTLKFEVLLDRNFFSNGCSIGHFAPFGFKQGKEAAFHRQAGDLDRMRRIGLPA